MLTVLEFRWKRTAAVSRIALVATIAILSVRCGKKKAAQDQPAQAHPAVEVVVVPVVQRTVPIYGELTARIDATC